MCCKGPDGFSGGGDSLLELEDDSFADEFKLALGEFVLVADLGAAEPEFEVGMKHLGA